MSFIPCALWEFISGEVVYFHLKIQENAPTEQMTSEAGRMDHCFALRRTFYAYRRLQRDVVYLG